MPKVLNVEVADADLAGALGDAIISPAGADAATLAALADRMLEVSAEDRTAALGLLAGLARDWSRLAGGLDAMLTRHVKHRMTRSVNVEPSSLIDARAYAREDLAAQAARAVFADLPDGHWVAARLCRREYPALSGAPGLVESRRLVLALEVAPLGPTPLGPTPGDVDADRQFWNLGQPTSLAELRRRFGIPEGEPLGAGEDASHLPPLADLPPSGEPPC